MTLPRIEELPARWRAEADMLEKHAAVPQAAQARALADELERSLSQWLDEPLTLEQAAAESEYSVDHLARLIREGTLKNAGRKHSPRICRRDLPKKPGSAAAGGDQADAGPTLSIARTTQGSEDLGATVDRAVASRVTRLTRRRRPS